MSVQPRLHLSPFVLSTVMFDNSNSVGDQEGFLIGNTQRSVRREISDHSMYNTEEDLVISIYSCIPSGAFLSFYDCCGNIKESVVDDFLGERRNNVVGWYRYRRNLVAYPSAREMIVHRNLKRLFRGNISFGDEFFVLGIFGSACYPTTATHTYDYAFFVQRADSFRSLSITLLNLGDTKTEYRSGSLSGSFINSSTFDSVLEIPWDFTSCWQTEDAVMQMHKMLREKCDNLAEELTASESVNNIIEQEVQSLEAELDSLTIKEPVPVIEPEADTENAENIPPEKAYLPFTAKQAKFFGKRTVKDLVDLNEELHPIYGKYFPQNRPQDQGSSYQHATGIGSINYNFLPPKKKIKVILQERRRIMDHDYVSDDDPPHHFMPETDEDSSDTYETGYLSSDAAGYPRDEDVQINQMDEFEITTEGPSSSVGRMTKEPLRRATEEPKVKVVYLEKSKNIDFNLGISEDSIQCPESVAEEIVESTEVETTKSEDGCPISPSKLSNISSDIDDSLEAENDMNKDESVKENVHFNQMGEFEITAEVSASSVEKMSKESHKSEEPVVKVVYLDKSKNIDFNFEDNIQCPESVAEEIVESTEIELKSDDELCPQSPSKLSNISSDYDASPEPENNMNKDETSNNGEKKSNVYSTFEGKSDSPLIVFCKPAEKEDKTSDSEN